ncbi:MAG: hypothetical protein S4CHLAM102_15760 [Chlamydiia bacterium]|nr:hypothetical protein [Chlamydiia bacterium]
MMFFSQPENVMHRILFFALSVFTFLPTLLIASGVRTSHTIIDQLPNGLTYFIYHTPEKESTIHMQLAVKAGSLHEEESERGLAHLVEHLVFRGSERFSDWEVIDFLEERGIPFGIGCNAYTMFDQTCYELDLPVRKKKELPALIELMADWAGRVNFPSEVVAKEKRVVLRELNGRKSEEMRTIEKVAEILCDHTPIPQRFPGGSEAIVEQATREQLLAYYNKWYHPENMAVIIAGDIDVYDVERQIVKEFSYLEPSLGQRNVETQFVREKRSNVRVIHDSETSKICLCLVDTEGAHESVSYSAKEVLYTGILRELLSRHFRNEANRLHTPYFDVDAGGAKFTDSLSYFAFEFNPYSAELLDGVESVFSDLLSFREFGFNDALCGAMLGAVLAELEQIRSEGISGESFMLESNLTFFMGGDSDRMFAEIEEIYQNRFNLTVADFKRWVAQNLDFDRFSVVLFLPSVLSCDVPSENEIRKVIQRVEATAPKRRMLESLRSLPQLQGGEGELVELVERWEMLKGAHYRVNGVDVMLFPTDEFAGEVQVLARAKGGFLDLPSEDRASIALGFPYAYRSGLGSLPNHHFRKYLSDHYLEMDFGMNIHDHMCSFKSLTGDVDELFSLVHEFFFAKRFDIDVWKEIEKEVYDGSQFHYNDPNNAFLMHMRLQTFQDYPLFFPHFIDHADPAVGQRHFQRLYANPREFSYLIVGDFDEEEVLLLMSGMVEGFPEPHQMSTSNEQINFNGVKKGIEMDYTAGLEGDSRAVVVFFSEIEQRDPLELLMLDSPFCNWFVRRRIEKVLRMELGESYFVSSGYGLPFFPNVRSMIFEIDFSARPEMVKELVQVAYSAFESIRDNPPSEREIRQLLNMLTDVEAEDVGSFDGYVSRLYLYSMLGIDFSVPPTVKPSVKDLQKRISRLAGEILQTEPSVYYRHPANQ